jgi:hypothetical protein
MAATTHLLTPPPPVRAFGLAAAGSLVGVAGFLAPQVMGAPEWVRPVGLVVLAASLALVFVALASTRRGGVRVELDSDGLRVAGSAGPEQITWADVVKVTRAPGRISLQRRDGSRISLVVPRGGGGDLDALGADVARHLDADRGYRPFS